MDVVIKVVSKSSKQVMTPMGVSVPARLEIVMQIGPTRGGKLVSVTKHLHYLRGDYVGREYDPRDRRKWRQIIFPLGILKPEGLRESVDLVA